MEIVAMVVYVFKIDYLCHEILEIDYFMSLNYFKHCGTFV
jgi:hypothetical protein